MSTERNGSFLGLRLLQTGEGRVGEERLLPEGESPGHTCSVLIGSGDSDVMFTFQSLVLVSRLPYTHLFHLLLQIIAPEFFEKLEPCLETGEDVMMTSRPSANQVTPVLTLLLCSQCATRSTSGPRPHLDRPSTCLSWVSCYR